MRPRILFLSANLPFPPHSGPTNRTLHILRELRRSFDVSLLAFARRHHHPAAADRHAASLALAKEIDDVAEPEPVGSEWSSNRRLWDHVRSLIQRKPYTYYEYGSIRFLASLRRRIATTPPALIHLDSLDLYRWVEHLPRVPITCTHHSVESELLRRRAARMPQPLGWYIRHQASLVETVERRLCPQFDLNLMMSPDESEYLRRLAPGTKALVVPNGADTDRYKPLPGVGRQPCRVLFVGPLYVFANRDSVEHFLSAIWPRVHRQVPTASLRVIGSCPTPLREQLERHPSVKCAGYVEDLATELAQATCAIVPLRIGGGTRLKIVDAWAMATPVVSTAVGCEGLAAVDNDNLLIADEVGEFAEAVVKVLRDEALAKRLGESGRKTVRERYDWKRIGATLRAAYSELIVGYRPTANGGNSGHLALEPPA